MTPGNVYWCSTCNKQVTQNCGHKDFGRKSCLVDMSPGKWYWCSKCGHQVTNNCGHFDFGNQSSLLIPKPGLYWCEVCCKRVGP